MIQLHQFHGRECLKINNPHFEAVVSLDVGPRLLHFSLPNQPNMFHLFPDQIEGHGEVDWKGRGGLRTWITPESPDTYSPDNSAPERVVFEDGKIVLRSQPDARQLQREMELCWNPNSTEARLTVTHRMTNVGSSTQYAGLWSVACMAEGGTGVLPMSEGKNHVVVWDYTDLRDPRLNWGNSELGTVKPQNDPNKENNPYAERLPSGVLEVQGKDPLIIRDATRTDLDKTKVGYLNRAGWLGYQLGSTLFVKSASYEQGKTYPDLGVNCEVFVLNIGKGGDFPHGLFIWEAESLAPIQDVPPGQTVEYVETLTLCKVSPEATPSQLCETAQKSLA